MKKNLNDFQLLHKQIKRGKKKRKIDIYLLVQLRSIKLYHIVVTKEEEIKTTLLYLFYLLNYLFAKRSVYTYIQSQTTYFILIKLN